MLSVLFRKIKSVFMLLVVIALAFLVGVGVFIYGQDIEKEMASIYYDIEFVDIEFLRQSLSSEDEPVILDSFEDIAEDFISNKTY